MTNKPLKTQIVVVGGGAAGLALVRKLGAKYGREKHDIILIEPNRTHVWKPLLHEVAAGALDANADEIGYGGHAARWNYRFFPAALEKIDRERQMVRTAQVFDDDGELILDNHEIRYDYLVLAMGGVSNDFGTPGVREHAMFLDSRAEADRFRNKLLGQCLRVDALHDLEGKDANLPICIIGGGATGVELSAELVNSVRALRSYGLERFDQDAMTLTLLEAGPRLVPALSEEISENVRDELVDLGVDVRLEAMVSEVTENSVKLKDGTELPAAMVLWAAGVRGHHGLSEMTDLELSRSGTIVVEPTLQTKNDPRIFAMGDCCFCMLPGAERPVPPRAQTAHQMAEHMVHQFDRLEKGQRLEPFVYDDKGSLISLSRFETLGSLMGNLVGGKMAIRGRFARMAYMSLYRMHLLSVLGWWRGGLTIVGQFFGKVAKPRLKLH
ncbi:NAD(P)/FAD-dependent oxidoreductase [Palleronia caenipelagi]|uniref:NAD(P)/FAD-dependent oxidoreductase n=1 Tax=Palleronia caenipelagi TaxID=2489174 RepID=A0A547Q9L1_9RHOB|nr:NAD(P)/FAD-dependent oxidoreductase [Palleronia caenipelagi]TRD23076.1 NAD(P)/FAD-dependent oxidoreductase [Palleronia caenipelagi]